MLALRSPCGMSPAIFSYAEWMSASEAFPDVTELITCDNVSCKPIVRLPCLGRAVPPSPQLSEVASIPMVLFRMVGEGDPASQPTQPASYPRNSSALPLAGAGFFPMPGDVDQPISGPLFWSRDWPHRVVLR